MTARAVPLVLVALVACRGDVVDPSGTGRVRLASAEGKDTVRFEVPVTAERCAGGGGFLVDGARGGQGVLVLLRTAGATPDTGTYPLLTRADSTAARGAIAAIRYSLGPVSHGLTVDDGTVSVTRTTPTLAIVVRGHGLETGAGGQRTAELALDDVPLVADSAYCRVQP